ncbi:MAG: hypothetical protein E6H05_07090 [Bacillati bacterium ANGP1]|uniref:DUF1444 family protein n=1 Tax=Candidatus Segetimicrobium genomatis TaxID=2569760 RepID=A0A537IV30_9BACT|nr:MAG: hypothetical protein E6H05_07090 [Terrabacteria group bacterium ANGP1]
MLQWAAALLMTVLVAAVVVRQGFVRFRRRVLAYLTQTADVQWVRNTAAGMACAVLGYNLEIDLLSTYAVRWRRRLSEAALFEELAAALRQQVPPVVPPPFPLVRDRVIPLLKRTAALPPLMGYVHENRIVRRTLDDQISIVYVIEGHHRMTLVTEAMPEAWQITPDELQRLAVGNLRARTRHILDEIGGPRAEYVSLDGFDAARLLVADLMVPAGVVDPLLAIPHEHACLIAPTTEADQLAAKAEELFRSARSPLTPRLYRFTRDGLLRAEVEPD